MKKTILYLTDSLAIGGAEQAILDLSQEMTEYNIIICSTDNSTSNWKFKNNVVEIIRIPKKHPYDLKLLFKLYEFVKRANIQLIHSHFPVSNVYGCLVAKLIGIPQVITIHGDIFSNNRTFTLPFAFRLADRMVAVSEQLRKLLLTSFKIDESKVCTIHNGINFGKFRGQLINKNEARNRLNLKHDELVIGSVGNLREVKGHKFMLDAIADIKRILPNIKLLLVGDGPERSFLETKMVELNIKENVIFLGWRNDIPQLLSAFDIYLCASLREGISIAILEAMAASLPVIATNVGGNPELVEDKKTGYLIPPKNSQAIAKAIISLINSDSKRHEMGISAVAKIKTNFQLEQTIRKYEKIYTELIHNNSN